MKRLFLAAQDMHTCLYSGVTFTQANKTNYSKRAQFDKEIGDKSPVGSGFITTTVYSAYYYEQTVQRSNMWFTKLPQLLSPTVVIPSLVPSSSRSHLMFG